MLAHQKIHESFDFASFPLAFSRLRAAVFSELGKKIKLKNLEFNLERPLTSITSMSPMRIKKKYHRRPNLEYTMFSALNWK